MKRSVIIPLILALLVYVACNNEEKEEKSEKAVRRPIVLENTPVKRPYTPAIEVNNILYVSGQIAVDQSTGKMIEGGIEEQTRQVLKNLKNVIEKAGYSMSNVAKCTVLLYDIAYYTTVNQIYIEFFPTDPPARMAFAVKDLPMGALIEIDAVAVR